MMKKIIIWRNYILIYLAIVLIFNLVLLEFPLTKVFGYEFSVLNSVLLVLLVGIYSIKFYKIHFENKRKFLVKELFISLPLFLIIPFCVSVVNSIFIGFCSFYDGVLFYIVLTTPSVFIAVSLAMISVVYLKRFNVLFFVIMYLGILSIIIFEIYFNPQVYIYNAIIGFFPGTVYDEGIAVSGKLILYRFFNILYFGSVLIYAIKILTKKQKRNKLYFTYYLLLFPVLFYFFSPDLGYSTTENSLAKDLNKSIETNHFVIHFDKRTPNEKINLIVLNHEYYYQELTKYFNCKPNEKINSFVFYNDDQKGLLFGSRNADVAKPWLNQIYISLDTWNNTLKHELAHCFSAEFGTGFLKLASGWNPALIEGIAEAADGYFDENELHYIAALAYNSGYKIDIDYLFTKLGFFNQASTMSYVFAGSFVQYLIERYGIENFKKYYANGDFTYTYKYEFSNVVKSYYTFLSNTNSDFSIDQANYYFGRKSIFQKVCPRAVSELLDAGWEQFNNYNYKGASTAFPKVLELTDSYSALVGIVKSLEKQNSIIQGANILSDNIEKYVNTSYYYNLQLILADLFARIDLFDTADSIYSNIVVEFPNRRLYYLSLTRIALVESKKIKDYLDGTDFDKYSILLDLNNGKYNYASLPIIIDLSRSVNESVSLFENRINKKFVVDSYISSYAAFKLSEYLMENFDFINAKKFAGLSLRYDKDKNFYSILKENLNKTEWFNKNANLLLDKIDIIIND